MVLTHCWFTWFITKLGLLLVSLKLNDPVREPPTLNKMNFINKNIFLRLWSKTKSTCERENKSRRRQYDRENPKQTVAIEVLLSNGYQLGRNEWTLRIPYWPRFHLWRTSIHMKWFHECAELGVFIHILGCSKSLVLTGLFSSCQLPLTSAAILSY